MRLTVLLFVMLAYNAYSQKHEIDFGVRGSVPISNLKIYQPNLFTRYDLINVKAINDKGISMVYKYKIWKKFNLFITTGLSFSQADYVLPINNFSTRELIAHVQISNKRFTYNFIGLEKKFSLYDNQLNINIGWSLTNEIFLENHQNYNAKNLKVDNNEIKQYETLNYEYKLDTYYNKAKTNQDIGYKQIYNNGLYYLQLQGKLSKNTYLNFALEYYRNIVFFYNYVYKIRYENSGTIGFYGISGIFDAHYASQSHFLGLKLGLSYKF